MTLAAVLVGVTFLVFWASTGRPLPNPDGSSAVWLEPLVTMIAYGVAGALLIDRRPDLPFGWLLAGAAVLTVVHVLVVPVAYAAALDGDRGPLVRWALTAGAFGFAPIAAQGLVNIRFPTGRPATLWGAVGEKILIISTALVILGGILGSSTLRDTSTGVAALSHPLTAGTAVGRAADAAIVFAPVVVLLGLMAGIGVVVRFFRAEGIARQQLKWRAVGVFVALCLFPLAVTERTPFFDTSLDAVVFVLTLVVPVLRYRLWSIDTMLRRSLLYGMITAALVVAFAALAALGALVVSRQVATPAAAAAVALCFVPLRARTQRLVDHLFYGGRQDPYRTLRDLSRRLNAVPGGDALGSFAHAAATALRLPYVAIQRADGTPVASYGTPVEPLGRWPLAYDGQIEGFLVVSARRGEDGFDDRDSALLSDIAGQIGIALHTRTLTAELLLSRQRLVTAREEERRRLRRELHDGLGPVLTAIGLTLDAARARLDTDPAAAGHHIGDARRAAAQALADLRKVVHGLRPPTLDELGLAGALRSQAEQLTAGAPLRVTIDADGLPDLPAAVEVAAYRTAVEAVTNAVRHSDGKHCHVRLTATPGTLTLQVTDDGGSAGPWLPGVGVTAMRERAAELGGSCHAAPGPDGGTVIAHFPLPETP
ncbi:histidine kinase [Phytohabitans sp. ZYX-F-186]|uniref:histidine kinase n=1 Tax=Phytohabitans maris TaxID=3071409 RepID=A0ABU0ZYP5_9ACTN|nr:histidine kinase [Phytohabitans sp. ZYX-F-186]MDQ7911300.1 histidine kinase [Phytohabitans sp. ZYX-F-186]